MRAINSNISSDIEIVFKDKPWPDRVTVSADGYRYTVYAAEKIFTYGEMGVLPRLARPNAQNNDGVFRIARVEDKVLASNYGYDGSWAYFLRALSVGAEAQFKPGSYHEISSAGWVVELDTQEPFDPEFKLCWFDACILGERRLSEGEVLVKGLVETTHANIDQNETFLFCGNELVDKGVAAVLVDKIWRNLGFDQQGVFEHSRLANVEMPAASALKEKDRFLHTKKITPDLPSVLDVFRLAYLTSDRQQAYLEMLDAVREIAVKEEFPDYKAEDILNAKRENAAALSVSYG
jgi:hypothetical protein